MIQEGSWVSVCKILLEPDSRADRLPDETRSVPFIMRVKGRLRQDANIGDEVAILTRTGRMETGTLEAVNPQYDLGYGDFVEELIQISECARNLLREG